MNQTIRSDTVERARRTRLINLGLIAGILILLNILGLNAFFRWDLTGRGIYSLSSASREAIRGLEDRLTVKAYFSEDLPAQFAGMGRFVKDKLDDYKAYGRGMVHFEFVDPANEEELQQEAASYGIQPIPVQVLERDKVEARLIYAALVFLFEGRSEVIPFIQSTAGLEYDITTAIRRVSTTELPVVGFLSGHGMATPGAGIDTWPDQLERHYSVQTVTLDTFGLVPAEVEALFLVGPTSGFNEWERYAIDQFIMRGGRTVWLLDLTDADLQREKEAKEQAGMLQQLRPKYMEALISFLKSRGESVYPDANGTLRVTYGTVTGYQPRDAVLYTPFTSLEGIVEKETGQDPFNTPPAALRAMRERRYGRFLKDSIGSVPVNFLSTCDTTGGNSGSATLNGKGELVGLLFDGNYESMISDWDFLPEITRSIHVDIRYILWLMEEVDRATWLLREMNVP